MIPWPRPHRAVRSSRKTPANPGQAADQKRKGTRTNNLRGLALDDPPGTKERPSPKKSAGVWARGSAAASVESLDRQVERVLGAARQPSRPISSATFISSGLSDRNETLFYRTVMSDPARFIPILYDPTVADACLDFGHIYGARVACTSPRDEGPHRRGAAQLAGTGRPLHLRIDRRPHPRSRRHRRQRHGHSDRQAAALYGLRRGTAGMPSAGAARHRHDQRRAARRSALSRLCARSRRPTKSWTSSSKSSSRRCRRCSRAAASTSRTGKAPTRSGCSSVMATRCSATTMTSRARRASRSQG